MFDVRSYSEPQREYHAKAPEKRALTGYYRKLGQMPADLVLGPRTLNKLFERVFDSQRHKDLDVQWRLYMNGLKTDFEKAVANDR